MDGLPWSGHAGVKCCSCLPNMSSYMSPRSWLLAAWKLTRLNATVKMAPMYATARMAFSHAIRRWFCCMLHEDGSIACYRKFILSHVLSVSHFPYHVLVNFSMNAAKIVDSLVEFNADLEMAGTKDGSTPLGWCAFKDSYDVSWLCTYVLLFVFPCILHRQHVGDVNKPMCRSAARPLVTLYSMHVWQCLCSHVLYEHPQLQASAWHYILGPVSLFPCCTHDTDMHVCLQVAVKLLNAGCNVNAAGSVDGNTPLHWAASR